MAHTSSFPIPENEADRDAEAGGFAFLRANPVSDLDGICRLACDLFDAPIATVSLLHGEDQWYLAKTGFTTSGTSRRDALCAHTVFQNKPMIVADTTLDVRFRTNPLVTGDPRLRFYAGVPISVQPNLPVGTFCVMATEPRGFSDREQQHLAALAKLVESQFRLHRRAHELCRSEALHCQAARLGKLGAWRYILADQQLVWSPEVFRLHDLKGQTPPRLDQALAFFANKSGLHLAAALARAINQSEFFDLELDFRSAIGAMKRVRAIGQVDVSDGRVEQVIGTYQDITEQYTVGARVRRMII